MWYGAAAAEQLAKRTERRAKKESERRAKEEARQAQAAAQRTAAEARERREQEEGSNDVSSQRSLARSVTTSCRWHQKHRVEIRVYVLAYVYRLHIGRVEDAGFLALMKLSRTSPEERRVPWESQWAPTARRSSEMVD